MLSRVADSIYWMARSVERAQNVARFVDVSLHLLLDVPDSVNGQWGALVKITADWDHYSERYGEAGDEAVIRYLTFDRENPNSVISCVSSARENARSVREIISSETWEALNEFYLRMQRPGAEKSAQENPHEFFRSIRKSTHLIAGVTAESMTRGEAWHFWRIGQLLERADKTSRILDIKYFLLLPDADYVGTPMDDLLWLAVLRSASALEMYRKTYGRVAADRVVRFLLLDASFPRAIRYSLHNARESLHMVSGSPVNSFSSEAERRLGVLVSSLDYTDEKDIIGGGLHEFLDSLQSKINGVGDAIHETFFALEPAGGRR